MHGKMGNTGEDVLLRLGSAGDLAGQLAEYRRLGSCFGFNAREI